MNIFRTIISIIKLVRKFFCRILRQPITYFITYILLIPIFAFIFYLVPNDFYHSTVQHEPFIEKEKDDILDGLKNALVKKLKGTNDIVKYKGYEIRGSSLNTREWNVEGKFASFVFYTHIITSPPPKRLYWGVRMSFNINPVQYSHKDTMPGEKLIWIPEVIITLEQLGSTRLGSQLPPVPVTEVFDTYTAPVDRKQHMYLPIPDELSKKILAFAEGIQGRPAKLPGKFVRMLYFSAVTITTLGYGDIVPLTTRARILIIAESISGVILIGLFLHSLTKKNR